MQTNLLRLPHDQMQTNKHLKSKSTRENGHPIEKQTAKYPTNSHSLKTDEPIYGTVGSTK